MLKRLLIKLKQREYWPSWIIYTPVVLAWIRHAIKLKSPLYFTVVNPTIETSGFIGESKQSIYNQIPKAYYPKTVFIKKDENPLLAINTITKTINFPLIVKPDIGDRGFKIKICHTPHALEDYLKQCNFNVIVQEYITYAKEYAIFYYKNPTGKISSICEKKQLTIIGNGKDTIAKLINKNDRAFLQIKRLKQEFSTIWHNILDNNEELILEPIGNHSRGSEFINRNNLIDTELTVAFNTLSQHIKQMNYVRFDIKCKSLEDLKNLKHFSIIEINGVTAEPAHIYDKNIPFIFALKDLLNHWQVLFEISKRKILSGATPMPLNDFVNHVISYLKYKRSIH